MGRYGRMPPTINRVRSSGKKLQLPKDAVINVGSNSQSISYNGAVVHWYYYKDGNRAVLSSKSADSTHDCLKKVDKGSITGVDCHDEFEEAPHYYKSKINKVESGQITISKELPNETYERLRRNDEIALQFIYPHSVDFVNDIWLVLIPANLFDSHCYYSLNEVL